MMPFLASLFGAIVGSFLNVVALRHGARGLGGRSACYSCARQLRWFELVPVVSWIALRGRCRTCGSSISIQYPLVEATTAGTFALIAATPLPPALQLAALLVAVFSILIAAYDIRHTIIPDQWVVLFSLSALLYAWIAGAAVLPVMMLLAGPVIALPFYVLWRVSQGRWMGLGDAKLTLGIGWFLGLLDGVRAIFLSFMLGATISIFVLLWLPRLIHALRRGRARVSAPAYTMKSEVPFGPFLLAAMWIVWLAGAYGYAVPILNI
ncbi:prepilin peptidase [Candidatus Kaiserbacteria bacterium]|nr:prepilin peptidase [Candidatus Kaiserbacteria bacterium]